MSNANKNEILFFEKWNELFGEQTFESFQVRYGTPLSILSEIDTALRVLHSTPTASSNVEDLLNEAKELFAKDPIIRERYSYERYILNNISTDSLEKHPIKIGDKISCEIELLRSKLSTYLRSVIDEIVKIYKGNSKKRLILCELIDRLGSQLMQQGFSMPFLRSLFNEDDYRLSEASDFSDYFLNIMSNLPASKTLYTCYCNVQWTLHSSFLKETDIEIIKPAHPIFSTPEHATLLQQNPAGSTIAIKIEAFDKHAARLNAIEFMKRLTGLIHLYVPSSQNTVSVCKGVLIEDPAKNVRFYTERDNCWREHIPSAKNPDRHVKKLLLLKSSSFKDWGLLENSLQYHSLAVQADTDEARLLNLWIALESLLPRTHESIIALISRVVPAIVTSAYANQLCVHLASTIKKVAYSDKSQTRLLPFWMNRSWSASSGRSTLDIDTHDLLVGLTDIPYGLKIKSLFSFADGKPLIINHLFALWKNQFKDRKSFYNRLESHQKQIDWQIRRIYRARNYVMHNGRSTLSLNYLVKNLQTYYTLLIYTILYDINLHQLNSLETAIAYRLHGYKHLLTLLDSENRICTTNILSLNFDHDWNVKHPEIWPIQQQKD